MLRLFLAILTGKIIFALTRLLKIGGGSAAPGLYALKIDPELVSKLASQIPQNIVITGTNGKTTTARLLSHFLSSQKLKIIRNSTGSNLERGIASSLVAKTSVFGKIKDVDLGIWELDEAAFNKTVFKIKPNIVVFLNAYRDQLDRYGEVDTVTNNWREALNQVDWKPTVLANEGELNTAWITSYEEMPTFGFRVKKHFVIDEKNFDFNEPKKKMEHFKDNFTAEVVKNKGLNGTDLRLNFQGKELKVSFGLPGIYQVYDLLAAASVFYLLNQPIEQIQEGLKGYRAAFGRIEKVKLGETEAIICLIKNPAGANSVFETVSPELKTSDRMLIALNDNFADGTDVSWIWDANFEQLAKGNKQLTIICSGTRAEDMALRLKYAGVDEKNLTIVKDLPQALKQARKDLKGRLFILPTYTALLELQKNLAKLGVKSNYWKEME